MQLKYIALVPVFICAFAVCGVTSAYAAGEPLGTPGLLSLYSLNADPQQRPDYERTNQLTVSAMRIALGPQEDVAGTPHQWVRLTFDRLNGQTYTLWMLLDQWPDTAEPHVAHYLWHEPGWMDAATYTDGDAGEVVLPRLDLWDYGWPQYGNAPVAFSQGSPASVQFQGWPFQLSYSVIGSVPQPPTEYTTITLTPDVRIGFIRGMRDQEGVVLDYWSQEEYTIVPDGETQWQGDIDAGINLFQAESHPSWLWRSSAYTCRPFYRFLDWPAHLYRSNFYGRAMYVDEPGWHYTYQINTDPSHAGVLTPSQSAAALQAASVAPVWIAAGNYSAIWINERIGDDYGLGDLWLVEQDYPLWETLWFNAWYELRDAYSAGGIVDEDAFTTGFCEHYNAVLGSQIEPSIENACAIRTAVMRGAARNFDKNWGIAVYTPVEWQTKLDTLPYFYEAGATHFYYWNSSQDSYIHVPWPCQRDYAQQVRTLAAANPDRDMDALLHAATVAVALPDGYTFYPRPLQSVIWLHLERINDFGLTYRQVLHTAAVEVERCLRMGMEFDVVVDDGLLDTTGYDEVVYIRENGTVEVVDGQGTGVLPGPRTPNRPDLGQWPSLEVATQRTPNGAMYDITMTAEFTAGSAGQATGADGNPLYVWEIFTPDNGFESAYYTGNEHTITVETDAAYYVRVSTTDTYGRPVSDDLTITVCDTPSVADLNGDCHVDMLDFALFAANWGTCIDPADSTCNTP